MNVQFNEGKGMDNPYLKQYWDNHHYLKSEYRYGFIEYLIVHYPDDWMLLVNDEEGFPIEEDYIETLLGTSNEV